MKKPIEILAETVGCPESILNIPNTGVNVDIILKFADTLIAQCLEDKMLTMAEQQLTGFTQAAEGYSIAQCVSAMGLTSEEWDTLKDKGIDYLPLKLILEVNTYFEEKE